MSDEDREVVSAKRLGKGTRDSEHVVDGQILVLRVARLHFTSELANLASAMLRAFSHLAT